MASTVGGRRSVAGELKENGQQLLMIHAHTSAISHHTHTHTHDSVVIKVLACGGNNNNKPAPAISLPLQVLRSWLERSLTGKRSLIYAGSMVDMWPLCGKGVHYGSTYLANSAFHPFWVGKWVVIHVITWIMGRGWERPLNSRPERHAAVWLQRLHAHVFGLSLQPIGCKSALVCDATARSNCSGTG